MTDLQETPSSAPAGSNGRRRLKVAGVVALVGLIVVGFLVWYFLIRDTSAASVDSDEAAEARAEALAEAAADDASEPEQAPAEEPAAEQPAPDEPAVAEDPPAPTPAPEPAAEETGAGLDGTWTVDSTIGTFNDACLTDVCDATFVGFRINEELANIGAKTVVGRTPGVIGTLEIEGTTITNTEIVVDMTLLVTDSDSRTNAIRNQAIETATFPEAGFTLTSPIDLGALPADGESVTVDAVGDLTIHGVTRTETIPLTAERAGDVIVVFGQLGPILLADYEIDEPQAAVVLSVEDNAIMELQLFFTRATR